MRIRYTPRAFDDREAIFDYLEEADSAGSADG
jgi:plasmid stabilization system protein ParE